MVYLYPIFFVFIPYIFLRQITKKPGKRKKKSGEGKRIYKENLYLYT